MALLVWLVSTLLLVSVFASPIKAYQLSPLRINADGTFKILFMTDLHLGEGDDKDEGTSWRGLDSFVDRSRGVVGGYGRKHPRCAKGLLATQTQTALPLFARSLVSPLPA
jgi:hypothetical protein